MVDEHVEGRRDRRPVDYLELREQVVDDAACPDVVDIEERDIDESAATARVNDAIDQCPLGDGLGERIENDFLRIGRRNADLYVTGRDENKPAVAAGRYSRDDRSGHIQARPGRSYVYVEWSATDGGVEQTKAEIARTRIDRGIVEENACGIAGGTERDVRVIRCPEEIGDGAAYDIAGGAGNRWLDGLDADSDLLVRGLSFECEPGNDRVAVEKDGDRAARIENEVDNTQRRVLTRLVGHAFAGVAADQDHRAQTGERNDKRALQARKDSSRTTHSHLYFLL